MDLVSSRYSAVYVPCVALYEYLYGHGRFGHALEPREEAVEALGEVMWLSQGVLEQALRIDLDLASRGEPIPLTEPIC